MSAEAIENVKQPYPVAVVIARRFRNNAGCAMRVVGGARHWLTGVSKVDDAWLHCATTGCAPGAPLLVRAAQHDDGPPRVVAQFASTTDPVKRNAEQSLGSVRS